MKTTSSLIITLFSLAALLSAGCKITVISHTHTWDQGEVTVPATCETQGTLTKKCTGCSETQDSDIPATGHNFGEYKSDNNATTEKDGTKTRTCSECKNTDTVTDEGTKLPLNGKINCYEGELTAGFYIPSLADGWYKCAVYPSGESTYPVGTALEISWVDKKVNVIVSDSVEAPSVPNADQYVLGLETSAFEKLGDMSLASLSVNIKVVPYNPGNKLKVSLSGGCNDWYIRFAFRNAPYPVESVTVSSAKMAATPAIKVSSLSVFELGNADIFDFPLTFEATDIHGNKITLENIESFLINLEQEFDVNFPL